MKTLEIAYNPTTGRCFKVPEESIITYSHITTVTRVPERINHIGICIKLEKSQQLRNQTKLTYSQLKGVKNA